MEERVNDNEILSSRIKQLERERDELQKDIEQLCLQQAGPSYLVVATRMHFQRTAGLEQEIEDLKKKLSGCIRDNQNLQEELSEVYHIKSQLADLHSAEVSKNMEAEKQIQFFQGCVAAAFSERDHSLMEAEKAKEREEVVSHKLNDFQNRVEKLTSDFVEETTLKADLQIELMKLNERNETFEKVINKFYAIRQGAVGCFGDSNWEDKCACLLHDPDEMWSFDEHNETSTSKYIASLEEELGMLRNSVDNLQNKLRVGMEIEKHLKEKFCALEEKHILSDDMIRNRLSMLRHFHTQLRSEVIKLLEEEKIDITLMVDEVQEKMRQLHVNRMQNTEVVHRDSDCGDVECRDVHITSDSVVAEIKDVAAPRTAVDGMGYTSDVLAQALQEKVDALVLLSQQEERHQLERDVNAILQKKMEELQRNLFQVTNEKVKALMELAQLRQEYQLLQESINHGMKNRKVLVGDNDKGIAPHELDGKLKNLLKRANLKHWIGGFYSNVNDANILMNNDESSSAGKKSNNYSVDFARLKVENATLQESMSSMEHLNSSIHRLRFSLLKAKDTATLPGPINRTTEVLDNIILEAKLMKTALGSSLPVSWSAEADPEPFDRNFEQPTNPWTDSSSERVDPVSSAGFEMVELLILAAELQKERVLEKSSRLVDD